MHTDITRLDLRLRRRPILWYAAGMGLYAFLIVALYPSVKSDPALESLATDNPTVLALLGVAGSFTSPVGWVSGNLYANFLPLLLLLLTIGYGASAVAGQSDDGTLGLQATLPISRPNLVAQKALTLLALAVPMSVVTLMCIYVGRRYDLDLPPGAVAATTAAVALLAADFGLVALLIGVTTGSRGAALGVASAIAAASYLVSSLAPVNAVAQSWRAASLFYWAVGDNQLATGPSPTAWTVLAGLTLILTLSAAAMAYRVDIQ